MHLSQDRSDAFRVLICNTLVERDLSVTTLCSLLHPRISLPTLTRYLHEAGRVPLKALRSFGHTAKRILGFDTADLSSVLRGSYAPHLQDLHERMLCELIVDDAKGVARRRTVIEQAIRRSRRIIFVGKMPPTFTFDEDQFLNVVKSQCRKLGLDFSRLINPKLALAGELRKQFAVENGGTIQEIVIVIPLSFLLKLRQRKAPFQFFDDSDVADYLDMLRQQLRDGITLTLLPLDDLPGGTDSRKSRLLQSIDSIAYFEPGFIIKRLPDSFTRRVFCEQQHPAVHSLIESINNVLSGYERRMSSYDMRAMMDELLSMFQSPRRVARQGEPALLTRVRRLLADSGLR